jgi:hypothetical protein
MMRMLLVITAVSFIFASGLAYGRAGAGVGVSGFSWNQAAAEESACLGGRRVVLSWRLVILGLSMSRSTADAASHTRKHNHN